VEFLIFDLEHYVRFFSINEAQKRGLSVVDSISVDNAIKHLGKPEKFVKSQFKDAAALNKTQNTMFALFESMKKKIEGNANPKVLDAGCGWGRWIVKLHDYSRKDSEMLGADKDGSPLRYALSLDRLLNVARSDVEYLPFKSGFFDLILCSAVIHEIKKIAGREKAIGELRRVLKTGGTLYIMDMFSTNVAVSMTLRVLQYATSKVEWLFKEARLRTMLETSNLKIVDVQKMRYRLFGAIEISMIVAVKE
jgi:ubiquinone/menaquinone biosynthesis C-methylase UbiE